MFDIVDGMFARNAATHTTTHDWRGMMLQMPAFWLVVRLDTTKCLPVLLKVKSK